MFESGQIKVWTSSLQYKYLLLPFSFHFLLGDDALLQVTSTFYLLPTTGDGVRRPEYAKHYSRLRLYRVGPGAQPRGGRECPGCPVLPLGQKMSGGKYRAKISHRKCLATPPARIGSKICFSFYEIDIFVHCVKTLVQTSKFFAVFNDNHWDFPNGTKSETFSRENLSFAWLSIVIYIGNDLKLYSFITSEEKLCRKPE